MGLADIVILVKGGGEVGSAVAHRLARCHFKVCITETPRPSAVCRTVAFCEAAFALGEIGDSRAVKPLIEVFSQDEAGGVIQNARLALGKMVWQPKNDVEKACYFIVEQQWHELVELGKPAVQPLIQALKDRDYDILKKKRQRLLER